MDSYLEEEKASLKSLEERVQAHAMEVADGIAHSLTGEPDEEMLEKIQELREVVEAVGLPGKVLQPLQEFLTPSEEEERH